jgi:hypothetical protein
LGGVLPLPEPARLERGQRPELDAWAATLASTLSQQLPPPPVVNLPTETTAAWRPNVGALTPQSGTTLSGAPQTPAGAATAALGGGDGTPNDERVHLSTHIPDLGQIAVVVDRSAAGVRVVIGVEDAHAALLMDPERARLQGALVAAGVGVDTIRVVQLDRRGTLLASKQNVSRTPQHRSESVVGDNDRKNQARGRKVNIVG